MGRTGARLPALALLLLAGLLLPALPAAAHASSSIPHASLSADGRRVTVEWTAAQDDTADVMVAAGLLTEDAMWSFLEGPLEDRPGDDEIRRLSAAPGLRAYLEELWAVRQDGTDCTAEAEPAEHFIDDGARIHFTCPAPVERAHVRITMLHDRDPAYRTYSVDGTIQTATHTASAPEQPWDFTLAASSGGNDQRTLLLAVLGVAAVALFGGWRLLRPSPAE